ncbi:MAG: sulfatase-like hydrolase/transferase [Desulfobacterales bacterium]|nr:sulfatase-like hydrolase/transferase [Desulfobacterales bacterium]
MTITRRSFIKGAAFSSALLTGGCLTPSADSERKARNRKKLLQGGSGKHPNVLVILTDQERQPRHTPPLSYPARDQLKPHAVEFTNAHCTYPLCSPSRATILTGRYPHEVGVLTNCDPLAGNASLSRDIPNLGRVLSEAGYQTGYFGKWHLSGMTSTKNLPEQYGFDTARLSNQIVGFGSDEFFAKKCGKWIAENKDKGPWAAVYSPLNPHDICYPFLRHLYPFKTGNGRYRVSLPPNFSDVRSPTVRTVREYTSDWGKLMYRFRDPDTRDSFKMWIEFYCYLLDRVEQQAALLLNALKRSGQWDDTVVIYTSDHGEMAGSQGLQNKGPTMHEENMNIPLWISDPRTIQGFHRNDSLISNLDLVPTICSLAGVDWPEPLSGMDLVPLLQGNARLDRDALFAEGGTWAISYWRGVRTRNWKYWHYTATGEELLHHIGTDPEEKTNLAGDARFGPELLRFREQVRHWRRETGDPITGFLQ